MWVPTNLPQIPMTLHGHDTRVTRHSHVLSLTKTDIHTDTASSHTVLLHLHTHVHDFTDVNPDMCAHDHTLYTPAPNTTFTLVPTHTCVRHTCDPNSDVGEGE